MSFLTLEHVTRRFGGLVAVNNLSIEIAKGKITGLIGPNGSGKSTAINLISGVLPLSEGSVKFEGKRIDGKPPHEIARMGIARTYQQIRVFENMTVLENVQVARNSMYTSNMLDVLIGTNRLNKEDAREREKAMSLLELVGLADKADEMPRNLPYGYRRCLEIARALALEPKILLLDEPAAGMNRDEFMAVTNLILKLKDDGVSVLLVEHTMEFVETVVDHVIVLNFGQKLAEGTFHEIGQNPRVIEAYLGKEEL